MFEKTLSLLADCRAQVAPFKAHLAALESENAELRAKLVDAEKGRTEAEAAAQALKDALTGFQASGN